MKKTILISLTLLIGLSACKKEMLVVNTDMIGVRIKSVWIADKDISCAYDSLFEQDISKITEGNFLVFKYIWSKSNSKNPNSLQSIGLIFKIPSYLPQFEFSDEQILETGCYYYSYGSLLTHYTVKNGNIKGVKQANGDWEITASIWTSPKNSNEAPIQLEFSRIFSEDDS
jgi:hypothetical protein